MNYIENSFNRLKIYCEKEKFRGWDPYDGLNSKIFKLLPLKNLRLCKLFWIQLFKHLPTNFRGLFLIPKEYNPKGLALFLSGYVNLYKIFGRKECREKIDFLINKLENLQSKGYSGMCWGYNFDWQSRTFFIPKFTPNIIVSTFVGNALLDVYEIDKENKYLEIAVSICDFILKDLNRNYENNTFCFSYSPLDNSKIFNASLLASKFLARVYSFTENEFLKNEAKKSVEFCTKYQNQDGTWHYGLADNQRWVDSFHTGYNLEAIYEYQKYSHDESYRDFFDIGLKYYLSNFFTSEGIPKYYNNSIYPIDVHSVAQLVVLLAKTEFFEEELGLINKVLHWIIKNMQDEKGFFYYQIKRYYKIRIPYIRWSQAWMFYALTLYMKKIKLLQ